MVISFPLVFSYCIFCLLFSYLKSAGIIPLNFNSFIFTTWYRFFTFCNSVFFNLFSSAGIIDNVDPVITMNSLSMPFTFKTTIRCLLLLVILFIFSTLYALLILMLLQLLLFVLGSHFVFAFILLSLSTYSQNIFFLGSQILSSARHMCWDPVWCISIVARFVV